MANEEQLSILKRGVDAWNKWRYEVDEYLDLSNVDLRSLTLSGADFTDVSFSRTNLSQVNLSKTDLDGANLAGANCQGANLSDSNLPDAIFDNADLSEANLTKASFIGARFSNAILRNADFGESLIGKTIFADVDLSQATGLETVDHKAPSIINLATLVASKGRLPINFLRGCGLSDLEIELTKLATPSLDIDQIAESTATIHRLHSKGASQYYSCFISYSSKDQEFAQRLHDDLQNNDVRCWIDREDLKIGDPIRPTIDRQIRLRDKLLVILSENSVKSEWVGDEVEGAFEEEQKSSRSVLFPIRLDDAVLNTRDDWAAKIKRRRHIGDFSAWKDKSSYQRSFERLLRDLKATA